MRKGVREGDNQMFKIGKGRLGMENYQIWEFFPIQTKNWFFSSSFSGRVVFYAIDKFHNFIFCLFKSDGEAIWLLMQKTSGAIWVDKIDSAHSAHFSYYFAH